MKSSSLSEGASDEIDQTGTVATLPGKKSKMSISSISKSMSSSVEIVDTQLSKDHLSFESEPRALSNKKKKKSVTSISNSMSSSVEFIDTQLIKDHLSLESEPRVISSKRKKKPLTAVSNSMSSSFDIIDNQPLINEHLSFESEPRVKSRPENLPIKNIPKPNSPFEVSQSVDTEELWSLFGMKLHTLCRRFVTDSFENLNAAAVSPETNLSSVEPDISSPRTDVQQLSFQPGNDRSMNYSHDTNNLLSSERLITRNPYTFDEMTVDIEPELVTSKNKSKVFSGNKPPKPSKSKFVESQSSSSLLIGEVKTGKKTVRKFSRRTYNEDTLTTSFEDILPCDDDEPKSNTQQFSVSSLPSELPLALEEPNIVEFHDEQLQSIQPPEPDSSNPTSLVVKLSTKPKKKEKKLKSDSPKVLPEPLQWQLDQNEDLRLVKASSSQLCEELNISDDIPFLKETKNEVQDIAKDDLSITEKLLWQPRPPSYVESDESTLLTSNAYIDLNSKSAASVKSQTIARKVILVQQKSTSDMRLEQPQNEGHRSNMLSPSFQELNEEVGRLGEKQLVSDVHLVADIAKSSNGTAMPEVMLVKLYSSEWPKGQSTNYSQIEADSSLTAPKDNVSVGTVKIESKISQAQENNRRTLGNVNFFIKVDRPVENKPFQQSVTDKTWQEHRENILNKKAVLTVEKTFLTSQMSTSRSFPKTVKFKEEPELAEPADTFEDKLAALSIPMIDDDVMDANKEHGTIIEEDEEEDTQRKHSSNENSTTKFYTKNIIEKRVENSHEKSDNHVLFGIVQQDKSKVHNFVVDEDTPLPELPNSFPPSSVNVIIKPVNILQKQIANEVEFKKSNQEEDDEEIMKLEVDRSRAYSAGNDFPQPMAWSIRNNIRASPVLTPPKQIVMPVLPVPEGLQKPLMLPKPVKRNIMSFELHPITALETDTLEDFVKVNNQSVPDRSLQALATSYDRMRIDKESSKPPFKNFTASRMSPSLQQQQHLVQQPLSATVTQTTAPRATTTARLVYVPENSKQIVTNVHYEINQKKTLNNEQYLENSTRIVPTTLSLLKTFGPAIDKNMTSSGIKDTTDFNGARMPCCEIERLLSQDMCTQTEDSPVMEDSPSMDAFDGYQKTSALDVNESDEMVHLQGNYSDELDSENTYRTPTDIGLDPMTPEPTFSDQFKFQLNNVNENEEYKTKNILYTNLAELHKGNQLNMVNAGRLTEMKKTNSVKDTALNNSDFSSLQSKAYASHGKGLVTLNEMQGFRSECTESFSTVTVHEYGEMFSLVQTEPRVNAPNCILSKPK